MKKFEATEKGVSGLWCQFLTVALIHIFVGGAKGQLGEVPPCDIDRAQLCFNKAIQSQEPSGCNWYVITPALYTCVDDSVAGCTYDQQTEWYSNVESFNASMQNDDCYPGCTDQANKQTGLFYCFDSVNFAGLALTISQDTSKGPSSTECTTLASMNSCLTSATSGCPALNDVAYARISDTAGGNAAYAQCGVSPYQPSPTSAPLEILNTLPQPTNPPTSTSSSDRTVKGTDLAVIILGALLIAATILIIIVAICLAIRRRAVKKRNIWRDWRPNGQEVYRDEPNQFIRRETIDFRSANEGGRVYRPHYVSEERDERNVREVYVNRGAVIQH